MTTASKTWSSPIMFRKVSCWPAKLASGRSSAVALDLTATSTSSPSLLQSSLYRFLIAFSMSLGTFALITSSLAFAAESFRADGSFTSTSRALKRSSAMPDLLTKSLNAWAVTAKPPGTGTFALIISPRLAPLPPTMETSSLPTSSNQITASIRYPPPYYLNHSVL